ncbi:MAG: TonB-dependent receptor [Candidatus Sulfopaludibacter sp.]|nr:TonB-dependent receptor [Candidatus Sulfopaludibacter sp.]
MRLLPNLVILWACLAPCSSAQAPTGPYSISGTVSDPSGAAIPDADVQVRQRGATAAAAKARTDTLGDFRVAGLPGGSFEIDVRRDGFAAETVRLTIKDRPPAPLRVELKLAGVRQEVTVSESAGQVSTDSADNLDVVTMDRQMMDNLPVFDQNYVAAMSQFLDPGSIGTGGVTLVVNGMEQRNVGVSASAIQQVKINQNPYSAEFSRPGRGRIEVITKPASQVYHGTFDFLFRDYHLNARDPFATVRPPEQRRIYEGSLLGPLGHSKKNSFLITVNREEQDLQAVVYAITPSGLLQQLAANPQRDTEISASITHQFTENHLATIRGNFNDSTEQNRGVGGFVLPEAGVNVRDREDEIYYNDSLVIAPTLLNQFRIVIGRDHAPTTSVSQAPGVVVPGSFTGGGAQADRLQTENHLNLNEIVGWTHGKHSIRGGINVPDISRRGLDDHTNVGGTYYFSTLQDYSIQRPYSLIQQQGDGHIVFVEVVAGGFVQDDYRLRSNLTLSMGLRYDWQNYFHDNNNVSPRLALAYSPGKSRKTVLRAGGGIFYDRTGNGPIFDLERYNGSRLRQIVLSNPAYPAIPDPGGLAAMPTTLVRLDPAERIPYLAQFSAAVERQIRAGTTLSVTYWASRGVSLFRSRDVNAPPPPDYLVRPDPAIGVYRQIESSGHMESNALEISFRGRITRFFQGMVQYTLGQTYNDVPGNYAVSTRGAGINAFPANNYDLSGEWARADYDARHRLNLMGTIHAAKYLDFGVALAVNSGMPYTETTGLDEYHTGYANARPPGVPRNSLQGPGFAELDVRWSHAFELTHKKEGPQFTVGVDAFNVTNRVNYVTYVGDLSSPFFGEPVSAKPPRRLQLSGRFEF